MGETFVKLQINIKITKQLKLKMMGQASQDSLYLLVSQFLP